MAVFLLFCLPMMKLICVLLVVIFSSGVHSESLLSGACRRDLVTRAVAFQIGYRVVEGVVNVTKTEDTFSWRDQTYGLEFFAMIMYDGHIFINARLVDHAQQIRSQVSGSQLFADMIEHFGAENLKTIEDTYFVGSDNHAPIERAWRNGEDLESAARGTWSGRQAQKHGFTVIEFMEFKELENRTGIGAVTVHFSRPEH